MIQQVDPVAPGLDLGREPGGQVRPGCYSARGGITQVRVATHGKTRRIGSHGGVKSKGGTGKLVSPGLDHDSERRSLRDDKLPRLVPLHQRAASLAYPRGKGGDHAQPSRRRMITGLPPIIAAQAILGGIGARAGGKRRRRRQLVASKEEKIQDEDPIRKIERSIIGGIGSVIAARSGSAQEEIVEEIDRV